MDSRRWLRALAWIGAGALILAALAMAIAPVVGLQHANPIGQLISFRGLLAVGSFAAALIAAVWFVGASLRRRRITNSINPRSRAKNRPVPPRFPAISLTLALAAAASGAAHLGVMSQRGLDPGALVTAEELTAIPEADGELTILTLNTQWANVPPEDVAALVRSASADVVLLPETPIINTIHIRDLLAHEGLEFSVHPERKGDSRDTSLLIAAGLGEYRSAGSPILGSARAESAAEGPLVTAIHALPPATPWPFTWIYGGDHHEEMRLEWVADMERSLALCGGSPWGILGGDFNGTRDHLAGMPTCGYVDVLAQTGAGGWGTWPDDLPAWMGAPIDRIYVDPAHWRPVAGWLVDMDGTDHRAVIARVAVL
ncbi:MAG: hypothetical protein Q4G64_03860 [bacterium]|nr:hypothetical protein [bacterium]